MKKNYIILAAVIILAIAVVVCPNYRESFADSSLVYNGHLLKEVTSDDLSFMKQYNIDYDLNAPIVVELNGEAIAENTELMEEYGSISAALQSTEGKNIAAQSNALISLAKSQVEQVLSKGSYTFEYEYNTALLGFSLRTTVGNMYIIRELDCVKRAYLAQSVVSLDTELVEEPYMISSGDMIGSSAAYELGYTGKGTLVAILDTAIDVNHEAFQGSVPDAKYTKETITELVQNTKLSSGASSGNIYKSEKFPYTYDYAGNDNNCYSTQDHGMHVAGIVGANSGEIRGVAYDAQIAFMKVFDDEGYSTTAGIIAALDDAIKLGADSVNMSLGLSAGLLQANQSVAEIYQRVFNSGITLCVAVGNDAYQGFNNIAETNLPLAANPDYGLTATPGSYVESFGVASAENEKVMTEYVTSNGKASSFADSATDTKDLIYENFKGQELEYEIVPGVGGISDFIGVDVLGKVAVIERGTISFTDKIKNAYNFGAIAVLVYDNEESDSLIGMQIDNRLIPSAFISRRFGLYLAEQTNKTLRFDEGLVNSSTGGQISIFSMWGCTSDLRLKPEITAPGGNIYSSVSNNQYAAYSGTSMASPQVAGGAAVIRQYLKEKFPEKTDVELSVITKQLLMSTAEPIVNTNGNYTSPRSQGAGMMDLESAIKSNGYLYTEGSVYAKCELGYSLDGKFTFEFYVKNISDKELVYSVGSTVLTDEATEINGIKYVTLQSRVLGNEYATVTIGGLEGGMVRVAANGETKLTVTIELTEEGRYYIDKDFENGSFVEGFITLGAEENTTEDLSMVFMGFYGDWLKAPVFDTEIFEDESEFFLQPSSPTLLNTNDGSGLFLGVNQGDGTIDKSKVFYSNKLGSAARMTFVAGLRRSVSEINTVITDESGKVVFSNYSTEGAAKSFYYSNAGYVTYYFETNGWNVFDENGVAYPDGSKFTVTVEAVPEAGRPADNSHNVWSFEFTVDNVKPVLEDYELYIEDGKTYLDLSISDNHYLQYLQIMDFTSSYTLGDTISFNDTEEGETAHVIYDITGLAEAMVKEGINPSKINVIITDWAQNYTTEAIVIGPQLLKLPSTMEIALGGSLDLDFKCYPLSYDIEKLIWTSSDDDIVKVEKGRITAVGNGDAVIRVSSISGLYAECKVSVKGIADKSVTLDFSTKTLTIGDEFTLNAVVYPTEATDKSVVWSSSNEDVVRVENGTLTAVGVGDAEITVTTKYGNKASCIIYVNPIYVQSVILDKSEIDIIIGDSAEIGFKLLPDNATYKDVVWTSEKPETASVEDGVITALGLGNTVIRATSRDGKAYAEVSVNVIPREVTAIDVYDAISIDIGATLTLKYTVLPENATYKDVEFIVDNDNISIEDGVITANKVGKSVLTIKAHNGVSVEVIVTVNPIYAQSISLAAYVGTLTVGEAMELEPTILPENTTFKQLTWSSDNEEVAIVHNGVVVAVSAGNAKLTAETVNGLKVEFALTVKAKSYVGIYVSGGSKLQVGESQQLEVDIIPSNADITDIIWTSSDDSIAFVDQNGVLRALRAGKATIKAQLGNVECEFEVSVTEPVSAFTIVLLVAVVLFAGLFAAMLIKLSKDKKSKNSDK